MKHKSRKRASHESKVFEYDVAKAYLELARAVHGAQVLKPKECSVTDLTMTNNTVLALTAQGYVFAVAAVSAFVNASLWKLWEQPGSPLKAKYCKSKNFADLIKRKLRSLEQCIIELCVQQKLHTVDKAEPNLWNDFLQILKKTRNFLIHPSPEPTDFDMIIGSAIEDHAWERPSKIAAQIIGYFYTAQNKTVPVWLHKNTEFRFETIRALSVQSKADL